MPRIRWTFDATPAAVHTVRRRMRAAVRWWGVALDDEDGARLELTASELLTNGLLHVGGRLSAELILDAGFLIVGVTDGSPVPPALPEPEPYAERGRGLALLDALGVMRGCEPAEGGKRCFAVLPLGGSPEGPPRSAPGPRAWEDRWTVTPHAHRLLGRLFPSTSAS
ncbi:ATP-binding protein [Streptomyces sp. LP11]|uniref:ATP-binding protein n=1 Tax=Streptomyces pyxinicus TaxID=2970331 RepID=A0ABT2B4D5_9ACTN|nr:ATP-binding protein [Streptomyces sp. LP11]MCS0603385.1 ATP-binding protein [Streptomyces sp. LP11]